MLDMPPGQGEGGYRRDVDAGKRENEEEEDDDDENGKEHGRKRKGGRRETEYRVIFLLIKFRYIYFVEPSDFHVVTDTL